MNYHLIERWVKPYYMQFFGGRFTRLDRVEEAAFLMTLRHDLSIIDETTVRDLIQQFGWREQLVGSYFAGFKLWNQCADIIGKKLIASEVTYAGAGHAFALACFSDHKSTRLLMEYLDYWLRKPECYYDQLDVLCALMWIDEQKGTTFAEHYIKPNGLWGVFTEDKYNWDIETGKKHLWHIMHYCQKNNLLEQT